MPISWRKQYEDGVRAASSGEHRRAVSLFTAIIDGGAPSWEPYFSRAWARLNAYSYDDAAEDAESDLIRALELGGSVCADVPALLGLILARRGDYKEAFPLLLQSVGRSLFTDQVERDLITSLASLLDTLESTGDPGEAVSPLTKNYHQHVGVSVQAAKSPSAWKVRANSACRLR